MPTIPTTSTVTISIDADYHVRCYDAPIILNEDVALYRVADHAHTRCQDSAHVQGTGPLSAWVLCDGPLSDDHDTYAFLVCDDCANEMILAN